MTAADIYHQAFHEDPVAIARAPGRINLIGEHTDYNGGMVLPMTLPLFTEIAIGPSRSLQDEIFSDRFDQPKPVAIDAKATQHWSDYASGALQAARKAGRIDGPMRIAVQSNLPDGAGLSSSAALIVAILKAAANCTNQPFSVVELAKHAQSVEHDHINVPCGLMDQMVIAANIAGKAMMLDTLSLEYNVLSIPEDWKIAVIHSGISRKLNDGRYAMRRQECIKAAKKLSADYLCLLTEKQKQQVAELPPLLRRRAEHVYRDHERVSEAADALAANDIHAFGSILIQGHASLRDAFEVSTAEIDQIVEVLIEEGACGARLSGGGFGGCIVAIMPKDIFSDWTDRVLSRINTVKIVC